MPLTNMKVTPKEQMKTELAKAPEYPYGLSLHLCDDEMKKLGISMLPTVGETMSLLARVEVKSISMNDTVGGEKTKHMELQITDMALGEERSPEETAKKLYPGD